VAKFIIILFSPLGQYVLLNLEVRGSEINKCPNYAGFLFAFEAQK